MPDIRRISTNEAYTIDRNSVRSPSAAWTLTAKSKVHAEQQLAAAGIAPDSPFADIDNTNPDSTLRLSSLSITPFEGMPEGLMSGTTPITIYLATAKYASITASEFQQGTEIPVDGHTVWSTEESSNSRVIDTDRFGHPLVNTAEVPIVGKSIPFPEEVQVAEWIRSNSNYFEAAQMSRRFRSKTNSSPWKGADKREVLCLGIHPKALDKFALQGNGMVKFTARWLFTNSRTIGGTVVRRDNFGRGFQVVNDTVVPGFTDTFLSMGTIEINPDFSKDSTDPVKKNKHKPIIMGGAEGDQPISEPVLLNASGAYERDDALRKPVTILYENIEEIDFNELPI